MFGRFPAIYTDERGQDKTIIESDGTDLFVALRGVNFEWCGDSFWLIDESDPNRLDQFTLENNELRQCQIEFRFPVLLQNDGQVKEAALHWKIHIGVPGHQYQNGNRDSLDVMLEYEEKRYRAEGVDGDAESALQRLQQQLPDDVSLNICFDCQYADYNPAGNSQFGFMECFRNQKQAYLKVKSKHDYVEISPFAERVQETFYYDQFERRIRGTGYRG